MMGTGIAGLGRQSMGGAPHVADNIIVGVGLGRLPAIHSPKVVSFV